MDFTIQLLNTNDPLSVLAGLQCLLAICRAYRFKAGDGENRTHFDKIIEASFPRLLAVSTELVAQESEEAGEMLHIALKAYKHATWVSRDAERPPPPYSPIPLFCFGRALGRSYRLILANIATARPVCLPPSAREYDRMVHCLPPDGFQDPARHCNV